MLTSKALEIFIRLNLPKDSGDVGDSFILGASDLDVANAIEGVAGASVFLEDVEATNCGHLTLFFSRYDEL